MSQTWRAALCLVAAGIAGGCASHRPPTGVLRALRPPVEVEALESDIGKVRQAASAARPAPQNEAVTLERNNPDLLQARALLALEPTAAHHRRVAEAYAQHRVLDAAYDHFTAALRLEPRDAASFEGRARVWRDWGFAQIGLADAHRAVFYAPDSPAARNTLGTLLLKVGLPDQSRLAFERALELDAHASYALNNLCYVAVLQGYAARAIETCTRALDAQPDMAAARHNRALAYAESGDLELAARDFSSASSAGVANYNIGVALLATGYFPEAERALVSTFGPEYAGARMRAATARRPAARSIPDAASIQITSPIGPSAVQERVSSVAQIAEPLDTRTLDSWTGDTVTTDVEQPAEGRPGTAARLDFIPWATQPLTTGLGKNDGGVARRTAPPGARFSMLPRSRRSRASASGRRPLTAFAQADSDLGLSRDAVRPTWSGAGIDDTSATTIDQSFRDFILPARGQSAGRRRRSRRKTARRRRFLSTDRRAFFAAEVAKQLLEAARKLPVECPSRPKPTRPPTLSSQINVSQNQVFRRAESNSEYNLRSSHLRLVHQLQP